MTEGRRKNIPARDGDPTHPDAVSHTGTPLGPVGDSKRCRKGECMMMVVPRPPPPPVSFQVKPNKPRGHFGGGTTSLGSEGPRPQSTGVGRGGDKGSGRGPQRGRGDSVPGVGCDQFDTVKYNAAQIHTFLRANV